MQNDTAISEDSFVQDNSSSFIFNAYKLFNASWI